MTPVVTVTNLHKRLAKRELLRGATFTVFDRDRIGMIGANGSGKSTLLKMLVSANNADAVEAMQPDNGAITWRRATSLEYVAQEPRFDHRATVGSALARDGVAAHLVDAIADGLRTPSRDKLITDCSIGERRRVALGHALLSQADVLALDEPTNHLDAQTIAWLENRLLNWRGSLLVVTHDRYFLDRVATKIVELDRGKTYTVDGDYSEFLAVQAERQANQQEVEAQRKSFIRNEIDWIRRGPCARGTKAKARIARFDAALAAAPTTDDEIKGAPTLELPSGPRLGNTIVDLDRVTKSIAGKLLFANLTLVMKQRDRIGIVGPNGVGKTTLVRSILGELPVDSGRVTIGVNTKPSYLEQGRTDLVDEQTVSDAVADGYDHVELASGKIHVKSFLRQLGFSSDALEVKVGQLSGGERNRVQLAKLLRKGGNLLILDEPTNDLDLITLGALEQALLTFPGCAFIVSHDRWFLDRVATAILAFDENGVVTLYEGDYTTYEEKIAAVRAAKATATAAPTRPTEQAKPRPSERKPSNKLTFREQRELASMEQTIAEAEAKVAELEAQLVDPSVFKDKPTEVPRLIAELEQAKVSIEQLFSRWQELEAKEPYG